MANDYTKNRDLINTEKIREIQRELPEIVTEFMRDSKVNSMSSNSRLGYIRDLRTFFYFLPRELAEFADTVPSQITVEQLGSLKKTDFDHYSEYLDSYIKPIYGTDNVFETDTHAPYTKSRVNGATSNEASGKARKIVALRQFFKYMFENEYIQVNYTERLHVPAIKDKEIIYLNENEISRLLETVQNGFGEKKQAKFLERSRVRDIAIISLLLATGIRASECVGIDLMHINIEEGTLYVTRKGGAEVELYFNESTAEAIAEYLEERKKIVPEPGHENALFLSSQRKRITTRALQNLVKKYATAACPNKQHLSPHKLRASYGTALYNKNGDIEDVANSLGHVNVNTTKKHYVHEKKERRKAAAKNVDWV